MGRTFEHIFEIKPNYTVQAAKSWRFLVIIMKARTVVGRGEKSLLQSDPRSELRLDYNIIGLQRRRTKTATEKEAMSTKKYKTCPSMDTFNTQYIVPYEGH